MTPELTQVFINRVQREHGETVCSNFVLDILLEGAQTRVAALESALKEANEQNAALQKRCQETDEKIKGLEELREKLYASINTLKNKESKKKAI